jgi:hypothetical protein
VSSQGEFNLETGGTDQGYTQWLAGRRMAAKELAQRMNLPLGHQVEVWLNGGIRLRSTLRLREEMLFIEEERVRHLELMVDRTTGKETGFAPARTVFRMQQVKHGLCLRHFGFINKGHLHTPASSTSPALSAAKPSGRLIRLSISRSGPAGSAERLASGGQTRLACVPTGIAKDMIIALP